MTTENTDNSWRKFQSGYLLKKRARDKRGKILRTICTGIGICLIAVCFFYLPGENKKSRPVLPSQPANGEASPPITDPMLSTAKLNRIISKTDFIRTDKNIFFIDTPDQTYQVTTSIDIDLQEYLLSLLARAQKRSRGKPRRIALVAMEADTGKILAMTGFDLNRPDSNPCTASDYPAASIFKIVTAAAAVQELGYTGQTPLYFNGNKYTLYKRQLKDIKNKYTYKISFSRAFAESVNPVFGKIGKNRLGKDTLSAYADAFGFNRIVNADLPFESGIFSTDGSDYHLAELGSGFNTDTTISPVFGAMLVSAVLNSGSLALPRIVEHVTDSEGQLIYKSEKSAYKKAITPETAKTMMQLMVRTVSRGTARKAFRGASKDTILRTLVIGGKTGSLYNREHTIKYDWFTGFGKEKKADGKIAVSIVVGHGKYIGTRAAVYAKMILKQYFKTHGDTTAQL